jgi:hypothetical protein
MSGRISPVYIKHRDPWFSRSVYSTNYTSRLSVCGPRFVREERRRGCVAPILPCAKSFKSWQARFPALNLGSRARARERLAANIARCQSKPTADPTTHHSRRAAARRNARLRIGRTNFSPSNTHAARHTSSASSSPRTRARRQHHIAYTRPPPPSHVHRLIIRHITAVAPARNRISEAPRFRRRKVYGMP